MASTEVGGRVPLLDLEPELEEHGEEYREAMDRVVRSGRFILGPEVEAFEEEAAAYLGAAHAVGVNSGTDALVIGLRSLGIEPGDEVITTPFTFFATAESIGMVGARPVFVDIEPESFNLDPREVEAAVTDRTRALLPVHLFGRPADMASLREIADRHDLVVLEDCAQSFGAPYRGRRTGSLGDVGAFSFFPSKNLGCLGDGGLIVTDDERAAELARMLRAHGGKDKYHNEMLGYNSRLDSLQAAVLRVKLSRVDERNRARRRVAERYRELLDGVPNVSAPPITEGHVFHQYTVRVAGGRRDELREGLDQRGVSTGVYYPMPCHRLPAFAGEEVPELPVAEQAATEVLSLPIWPELSAETQERVVDAMQEVLEKRVVTR